MFGVPGDFNLTFLDLVEDHKVRDAPALGLCESATDGLVLSKRAGDRVGWLLQRAQRVLRRGWLRSRQAGAPKAETQGLGAPRADRDRATYSPSSTSPTTPRTTRPRAEFAASRSFSRPTESESSAPSTVSVSGAPREASEGTGAYLWFAFQLAPSPSVFRSSTSSELPTASSSARAPCSTTPSVTSTAAVRYSFISTRDTRILIAGAAQSSMSTRTAPAASPRPRRSSRAPSEPPTRSTASSALRSSRRVVFSDQR